MHFDGDWARLAMDAWMQARACLSVIIDRYLAGKHMGEEDAAAVRNMHLILWEIVGALGIGTVECGRYLSGAIAAGRIPRIRREVLVGRALPKPEGASYAGRESEVAIHLYMLGIAVFCLLSSPKDVVMRPQPVETEWIKGQLAMIYSCMKLDGLIPPERIKEHFLETFLILEPPDI